MPLRGQAGLGCSGESCWARGLLIQCHYSGASHSGVSTAGEETSPAGKKGEVGGGFSVGHSSSFLYPVACYTLLLPSRDTPKFTWGSHNPSPVEWAQYFQAMLRER